MKINIPHENLKENECLVVGIRPTPTDEYVEEMVEWILEYKSIELSEQELKDILMCLMLNENGQRDKYYNEYE